MTEFYKHFSEEEKDFIVKEFTSWQKMGLAVEEMIDDVVENVMAKKERTNPNKNNSPKATIQ
jgi:hypothetical protein